MGWKCPPSPGKRDLCRFWVSGRSEATCSFIYSYGENIIGKLLRLDSRGMWSLCLKVSQTWVLDDDRSPVHCAWGNFLGPSVLQKNLPCFEFPFSGKAQPLSMAYPIRSRPSRIISCLTNLVTEFGALMAFQLIKSAWPSKLKDSKKERLTKHFKQNITWGRDWLFKSTVILQLSLKFYNRI